MGSRIRYIAIGNILLGFTFTDIIVSRLWRGIDINTNQPGRTAGLCRINSIKPLNCIFGGTQGFKGIMLHPEVSL
ncbi:hypothetical protein B6D51_22465 [Pseudomonas chlororaphis subsp. chlororaphis]|nr:hypothetical protein B6D51_22465 [Pseudomonas chlororaphis subsp. chlororaphis]